ncbi:alpha/beta hydrolase domain-containing protein [Streptomyces eurythermus]|uniref:alpha/beta hydrolase domain-containing protein n=1 Tax=Streptomyces eurythermus TaxID=42237 RepID=UPI0036D39CC5
MLRPHGGVGSARLGSARLGPARPGGTVLRLRHLLPGGPGAAHSGRPDPAGGFPVRTLLADGEWQSAGFMTTYVNAVQPAPRAYDGFMVHSNSAIAAPVGGVLADILRMPNPSRIRTELSVPTFVVLTETDAPGAAAARQPDTDSVVPWELAGTAHGDQWAYDAGEATVGKPAGLAAPSADCAAGSAPFNDGPGHWTMNAALRRLADWARGGRDRRAGSR